MYRVGFSSSCFELNEANFKALNEANIEATEISCSPIVQANINYSEVKRLADKYNVELWSCHLPFYPFEEFDISALDKNVRGKTVEYLGELIKKAAYVGIDKFVIHPSGEPIADEVRGEHLECASDSLDILAEIAYKEGALIAVEDLPRTCLGHDSRELCKLISANEKLRVCFDTNHLTCDDNLNFIKTLGDKIITLHVSDYDFIDEKHWLPCEGKNDWKSIINAIKDIGYNGVWMYELNLKAPKTIKRERDLKFEDIYNNAVSIFNNEKPPFLGEPIIMEYSEG